MGRSQRSVPISVLAFVAFMTDVDGLHGSFLTTDENGQRLFVITSPDGTAQNAALTVVQLAVVPLGIGTISPSTASASGGTTLTIRGSGFQSGTTVSFNGKSATVSFKDVNTLGCNSCPNRRSPANRNYQS